MYSLFVTNIRQKLQKELKENGFVLEITTDTVEIEELKNRGKPGKLQKVIINDFPYTDDDYWSWRINLEHKILGLATADKTVDIALAILQKQKQRLDVYLIELKSQIDDQELNSILQQFQGSISRFYFLLLFNDRFDHKNFPKLKIQFKGIVFYNGKQKLADNNPNKDDSIHRIFKDKKQEQAGKIECDTILGRDKIPIKFFCQNFDKQEGIIEMSFNEIIEKIR